MRMQPGPDLLQLDQLTGHGGFMGERELQGQGESARHELPHRTGRLLLAGAKVTAVGQYRLEASAGTGMVEETARQIAERVGTSVGEAVPGEGFYTGGEIVGGQ